jgi:hypothetical protein
MSQDGVRTEGGAWNCDYHTYVFIIKVRFWTLFRKSLRLYHNVNMLLEVRVRLSLIECTLFGKFAQCGIHLLQVHNIKFNDIYV